MSFFKKLQTSIPTISYEFFPPKTSTGWATLYGTLSQLSKSAPDYVSVTYGAGGSTREKTVDIVSRIQKELNIEAIAHLTCVGHSQTELESILTDWNDNGVQNVLALRGDPPKGQKDFEPHPDGFNYATELIEFINNKFEFNIGCACYPEVHLEAVDPQKDLEYLKLKQDLGASFAITQLFFKNEYFYDFREKAASIGITMPIIAGIMPVTSFGQLDRFKEMSGTDIPESLKSRLKIKENVIEEGISYAVEQCSDLLKNDTSGIHLYTLNKSTSSIRITEELRKLGYFQTETA